MKYLHDIIDKKNYVKLMRAFGGSRIWIPKLGNPGHRNRGYYITRNSEIRTLKKSGKTIEQLSGKYGLSPKRIYTILNGVRRRTQ